MNWAQSKDPVSHMCLAVAVVASWSLTQRWLGGRFGAFYSNIYREFSEMIWGNLNSAWKVFTFHFNYSGKYLFIGTRLSFLVASLENNDITFIYFMLQSKSCTKLFN